jgi:hypothetical protein
LYLEIGEGEEGFEKRSTDLQIRTVNSYLELGEVETGSDRWRRRWK